MHPRGRIGASRTAARALAITALQRVQPTDPRGVFYSAFGGHFADNPRAIFEELSRRGEHRHTWRAAPQRRDDFPADLATVTPGERAHARAVASARHIVVNTWMPQPKPPGSTWVQTWHGTPLKRIAFDKLSGLHPDTPKRFTTDVAKWDFLVSPNRFSTPLFRQAFRYEGPILETGYPRNDILNAPDREAVRERLRRALNIPDGARAILYAPTWRDSMRRADGRLVFPLPFDLARMEAQLGDGHVLLIRLHRGIADELGELPAFARNLSAHPDIRELYLAADILVTDYSSVMFDFAVTGKPMVFFTHDLASYRDDLRGFYFDLEAEAPGPLASTEEELVASIAEVDRDRAVFADRYAAFRGQFCTYDDGFAAQRVVDAVFGPEGPRTLQSAPRPWRRRPTQPR